MSSVAPPLPKGYEGYVEVTSQDTPPPLPKGYEKYVEFKPPSKEGFGSRLYQGTIGPVVDVYQDYAKHTTENAPKYGVAAGFPAAAQAAGDVLGGIGGGMINAAQRTYGALRHGDVGHAIQQAPGMVPLIGPAVVQVGEDAEQGNYSAALGGASALALAAAVPELREKAPGAISRAATKGAALARDVKNIGNVDPKIALARALKPGHYKNSFLENVDTTLPIIKKAAGKDIRGVEDVIPAAKTAVQQLQTAFGQWMDRARQMGVQVKGDAVVDATRKALSSVKKLEDPQAARSIVADAQSAYAGKTFTVDQLWQLLKDKNAEVESFYDKATGKQQAAVQSGTNPAIVKAQRDAIANALYNALDPEKEGAGPRLIQQRTGHVIDLLDAAEKRRIEIMGEKPVSRVDALGKKAAALIDLPGKAFHGNIEEGVRKLIHSSSGTSDPYIQRAFSQAGNPEPLPAPQPFQARRLLGKPSIITPAPPDASGPIRSAGPYMGRGVSPDVGTRRLAPPGGPIHTTPVPPDTSGPVRGAQFENPGLGGASTRKLPPPSRIQSGGFAVGEEMVPVKNPKTGRYEYVPEWMLQKTKDQLQTTPAPPLKPPSVGTVEDGWEFTGGDPADPKSWQKQK